MTEMEIDIVFVIAACPPQADESAILKPFLSFRLVRNLSLGFPTE